MKLSFSRLIVLFVALFLSQTGQAQSSSTNKSVEKSTFNLSPENFSALQNSVNLLTGQVAFPIQVAATSGRGGLGAAVTFQYSSAGVKRSMGKLNKYESTGILGLGWSMDLPKIVVDHKGTGTYHDDEFYLVENGSSTLLVCTSIAPDLRRYATKSFQPWIVEYLPSWEKWFVTHEDGTVYVYGDKNSERNTVQWMVKWGNWIGNSVQPAGQSQMAFAWNLSEVYNMYRDKMLFEYEAVEEYVAASAYSITTEKKHTKASYLKKITDPTGQTIELNYQVKDGGEYHDPHTEKPEPDAYQEKFETMFLDNLTVKTSTGELVYTVELAYEFIHNASTLEDKRVVRSIQKKFPNNQEQPKTVFKYAADGPHQGIIYQVDNSLGANVSFNFQTVEIPGSDRRFIASPPAPEYGQPKVHVSDDYAIITWRKLNGGAVSTGTQPVKIMVYTWDGSWNSQELWHVEGISGGDYDKATLELNSKHFIYHLFSFDEIKHKLFAARRNVLSTEVASKWTKVQWDESKNVFGDHNDFAKVIAGDQFVAFVDKNEGNIKTQIWKAEQWNAQSISIPNSPYENYSIGGLNYIFVQNDNDENTDKLHLYYLDQQGVWHRSDVPSQLLFNTDGGYIRKSYLHFAPSFAVAFPQFNDEMIYMWDENYQNFARDADILGGWEDSTPVAIVNNTLIGVVEQGGQEFYAVRFDGSHWTRLISEGHDAGNIYFGDDYVMLDIKYSLGIQRQLQYNPNNQVWSQIDVLDSRTDVNHTGNYLPIRAGINMLSKNTGRLFAREANGSWIETELVPNYPDAGPSTYPSNIMGKTFYIMAPNFIAYDYSWIEDGGGANGSYIAILENDKIKSYTKLQGYSIGTSGTNVSMNMIALYANGNTVHLRRFVDGNSVGNMSTEVVVSTAWSDGNSLFDTGYFYSGGKMMESGSIAYFNNVKIVPGSLDANVIPYGYTLTSFYNGFPLAQLTPAPTSSEASRLNLLKGTPYESAAYSSTNVEVSKTTTRYLISETDITPFGSETVVDKRYLVRPHESHQYQDGIHSMVTTNFYLKTGFAESTTQRNSETHSGSYEELTTSYRYFFEAYDPGMETTRNMLLPVVQTTVTRRTDTSAPETLSSSATKWKMSALNFYPDKSYVLLRGASPAFFPWEEGQEPGPGWLLTSQQSGTDLATGAPLEVTGRDGTKSSTIYDVSKTRVIATVSNAAKEQVAFSSFEDNDAGNWTFDANRTTALDQITGSKSFSSNGNNTIAKSQVPAGIYEISYWTKNTVVQGTPTVELPTGTELNSRTIEERGSWILVSKQVQINSTGDVRLVVPVNVNIDELRLKPVNAVMSTFVFDSKGNPVATTDNNLISSHIEYDGQYRKYLLKDHNGFILKKYDYHFRDQE